MTAENLLDAMGMVDDHFLAEAPRRPVARRLPVLAAVFAALMLSAVTAMAVSEDFREIVFSVFCISGEETPPIASAPADAPSQGIEVVNIDGAVTARYFAKEGIIRTQDGGFYTRDYQNNAQAVFWEVSAQEMTGIPAAREDFLLLYAGRELRIRFDWAVLNEKLAIVVLPEGLDEDPMGNGWNLQPIGDRVDAALLSVPVLEGEFYNIHHLLLDLDTMHTEVLWASDKPLDGAWFTEDLRYAIGLSGGAYLFFDVEAGTESSFGEIREPYFLNNDTIICKQFHGDGSFDLIQYHIPTGISRVLLEHVTRKSGDTGYRGIRSGGGEGFHGLLYRGNGTLDVIDLRTAEQLQLTGLDTIDDGYLRTDESPDGSRILLAWEQTGEDGVLGYGFTTLGILDPSTGELKLLRRDVSGHDESIWGWLDETTVVILATDGGNAYWVYTYCFE